MKHGVIPVRRCFMRLRTVASHCHTPTPAITSRSASDCETAAGPNERRSCRLLTSLVATAAQLEGGIARGEGAAGSHTSRNRSEASLGEQASHWRPSLRGRGNG
jgi:hypothetical protein